MKQSLMHCFVICLILMELPGCAGNSRKSQWEDIDYSSVYRRAQARENDPGYTAPSVIGCVDDDLYNCNPR